MFRGIIMINLELDLKAVQIMNNIVEDTDVIKEVLRFLLRLLNLY